MTGGENVITGRVVTGKQLGRTLGFPTANIEEFEHHTRLKGVYAGLISLEGRSYRCMVNIGSHPTLPEGKPTIEAHIIDFSGDLYGKSVTIEIKRFLRGERRFGTLDELVTQLKLDLETVKSMEF